MRQFKKPSEVIEALNLYGPMVIADFGAGAGLFTIPSAERITSDGKVFALDIQEEPLEVLRADARSRHLHNIHTMRVNLELPGGSKLKDASVDLVLATHVLFQTEKKDIVAREAFRILKKGGTLVIVEWYMGSPVGPRVQVRIPKDTVTSFIVPLGFRIQDEFLMGNHSYGIILKKANE